MAQSRVVFGLSGAAYAAKARGSRKTLMSAVGITHRLVKNVPHCSCVNSTAVSGRYPGRRSMVKGRLNKVSVGTSGQMIIDML